VQGLIAVVTKGNAVCNESSLQSLYVAADIIPILQKTKVDKTVRKHQLPKQKA